MDRIEQSFERYQRQILIDGWGVEGQRKLRAATVAVVGVGGLGCTSSIQLVVTGVGKLILIDHDKVSLSDLNRQILYSSPDVGKYKVEVASVKLRLLNPDVQVEAYVESVDEENVSFLLKDAEVIVDGLDKWKTRFIINDYCLERRVPFVHAGVSGFCGQISTILPGKGPCLRCIFPQEPAEKDVVPVLSATPALLASLQAMEVIKLLLGIGKPLIGKLLFIDGEESSFEVIDVKINPNCPVCGKMVNE
ncbi:MAG: HesA/MoeB/ThiF family protein [Nitrososphaerota archaeon]|nr:HesA/MoeB/ThiF family protein [Candidatus Bathyarchaeota archaeon]MDW8048834.1 HesA/MoeB/ThiF family protein [Nitrososphaerota archaeon]